MPRTLTTDLADEWIEASSSEDLEKKKAPPIAGHQMKDGTWVVTNGCALFEFDEVGGEEDDKQSVKKLVKKLIKGGKHAAFGRLSGDWLGVLRVDPKKSFPVEEDGERGASMVYKTKRGREFYMGKDYYEIASQIADPPIVRVFTPPEKDGRNPALNIFLIYDGKELVGAVGNRETAGEDEEEES